MAQSGEQLLRSPPPTLRLQRTRDWGWFDERDGIGRYCEDADVVAAALRNHAIVDTHRRQCQVAAFSKQPVPACLRYAPPPVPQLQFDRD